MNRSKAWGESGRDRWSNQWLWIWILGSALIVAPQAFAVSKTSPDFIVGYATAVLEISEPQVEIAVEFEEGALRVDFVNRPDASYDTLLRALLAIEGVDKAEIHVAGELASRASHREERGGILSSGAGPEDGGEGMRTANEAPGDDPSLAGDEPDPNDAWDVLSSGELFKPLMADPRWPHFSVSHLWYLDDDELERVGSANFGESFSFLRSSSGLSGQWEFGLQAGVFSVFDLEASSSDLVNSDFLVGLMATHHLGDFTSLLRVYHQSSHLGDEFLLRTRVNRVNLSFEVIDLLVAYEPLQWLRLYGGGGVIFHREPALDRGIVQTGIEVESPVALAGGYFRPVLAADFQFREESDWQEDISVRGGVQIEHPFLRRTRLQLLGEFYSGRSPNGQFYDDRIETIGIGLHLGI